MSTRLDLDRLKTDDYFCYQIASRASGKTAGWCEIDIGGLKIGPEARFRLAEASMLHSQVPPVVEPTPEPVAPVQTEPLPEQIDFAAIEAEEKRDLQRRSDEASAKIRLQQLADEEGLEESTANVEAIKQFLQQHLRGYLSAEGVNAAYANLGPRGSNVLTFKPAVAPAPPVPVAFAEVLDALPNGEPRLPLDASEYAMRRSSVKQLLDLNQRRREASGQTIIGKGKQINRIGSKF